MRMLLIVFRESMTKQVHSLLKECEVTAFTELQNVGGKGKSGPTLHFSLSASANRMILTALPEQAASRLIERFTQYKTQQAKQEGDGLLPIHVFVLPCEQVV